MPNTQNQYYKKKIELSIPKVSTPSLRLQGNPSEVIIEKITSAGMSLFPEKSSLRGQRYAKSRIPYE